MAFALRFGHLAASTALATLVLAAGAGAQSSADPLAKGFENPPNGARPRVWWHWMNGNITKEGIALDLEWMKRTGLGGFQNFDAALNTPKVVDKRLIYMTPEWKDAFLFATKKADTLGLEMAIAGSPGWSESGGPWVKPSQAMKKFVWSETFVEEGKPFSGALAKPPTVSGPFQSLAQADGLAMLSGNAADAPKTVDFYADSAVVAYRLPETGRRPEAMPQVTSSSGSVDGAVLASGDLMKFVSLPKAPAGQSAWIQFGFPTPTAIRGVTFALGVLSSR
jgi:hypothetical protein